MIGSRTAQNLRTAQTKSAFALLAVLAVFVCGACGKKGPPLPPLVKLPSAPANFTADRRGVDVDLQFQVPSSNTDNTRPANISRVDVYAITAREAVTDDQIVKQGTRVASIAVKTPKDPNQTIEEDEPENDMEAPEGNGLDQGAVAHAGEELTTQALAPVQLKVEKRTATAAAGPEGPLLPPRPAPLVRTYLAVGVSSRDRKGPPSRRGLVPLVPPPPPPQGIAVTYDEKAITVKWIGIEMPTAVQAAPREDELPSRALGMTSRGVAYNVYDAASNARLTASPVNEEAYSDSRITWGQERCYTVRTVETFGDSKLESDGPAPECVTPKDRFAPAAPRNLQSSPAPGAISLIWEANGEPDLAGYIVLRGDSAASLQPVTLEPIQESTFRDSVQPGARFTYAVIAVDRAGNRSPASNVIEEAARE